MIEKMNESFLSSTDFNKQLKKKMVIVKKPSGNLEEKEKSEKVQKPQILSDREYGMRKNTFDVFYQQKEYERTTAEIIKTMALGIGKNDHKKGKMFINQLWSERFYNSILNHAEMDGRDAYLRNQRNSKILDDFANQRLTINKNFMPIPTEDELYEQAYRRINYITQESEKLKSQNQYQRTNETLNEKFEGDNPHEKLVNQTGMINNMTERSSNILYKASQDNQLLRDIQDVIVRVDRDINEAHTQQFSHQIDDYFKKVDFRKNLSQMQREITHRRDMLFKKNNRSKSHGNINNLLYPQPNSLNQLQNRDPIDYLNQQKNSIQKQSNEDIGRKTVTNSFADIRNKTMYSTFHSISNSSSNLENLKVKYDRRLSEIQLKEGNAKFNLDFKRQQYKYDDPEEVQKRRIRKLEWIEQNKPQKLQPGELDRIINQYRDIIAQQILQSQRDLEIEEAKQSQQNQRSINQSLQEESNQVQVKIDQEVNENIEKVETLHQTLKTENDKRRDSEITKIFLQHSVDQIAKVCNQMHVQNIDDMNRVQTIKRAQSEKQGYKILIGKPERVTLREINKFLKIAQEKNISQRPVIEKGQG